MLVKLYPPESEQGDTWAQHVIYTLREATLAMLERLLPFLSSDQVEGLYDWSYQIIRKYLRQIDDDRNLHARQNAINMIQALASSCRLDVTIKVIP